MAKKHMFRQADREEILRRLQSLDPHTQPEWGSLSAEKMMAHLIDGLRVSFGEIEVAYEPNFLGTALGRWLALQFPIPKGKVKAPAIFFATEPGVFDADRQQVLTYIERFAAGPDQQWGISPLFGKMKPQQWARLHYAHFDHHLRQFGC